MPSSPAPEKECAARSMTFLSTNKEMNKKHANAKLFKCPGIKEQSHRQYKTEIIQAPSQKINVSSVVDLSPIQTKT